MVTNYTIILEDAFEKKIVCKVLIYYVRLTQLKKDFKKGFVDLIVAIIYYFFHPQNFLRYITTFAVSWSNSLSLGRPIIQGTYLHPLCKRENNNLLTRSNTEKAINL